MKLRDPISTQELERRWSAVRSAMNAQGLDAIVMQNTSDWIGGYVRWFTGIPATNGYPRTVVFWADRPMTVIEMGPFGGDMKLENDEIQRGVGRILTTPSFVSIVYTTHYDAELLAKDLTEGGAKRIGLLTPGALPSSVIAAVNAWQVEDASDLVDTIKAVKSPEEVALLWQAAALQDKVVAKVLNAIHPGMTDNDVINLAQSEAHRLGSDQGVLLATSAKIGKPARLASRHLQGKTIEKGDQFTLLVEVNGPGGMYAEVGRTIVLGKASPQLLDHFETMKAAQAHTLSLIRPGALPSEIAAAHDDWMLAHGLPQEFRLYAHGQGYDMVERPMIRRDETLALAEGQCLAVHPGFDDGTVFSFICDNYMVEKNGPSDCMHKTEKKVFEVL